MGRPRRQPRVAPPLKELRPAPANPIIHASMLAPSPPALRPPPQSRNNNQSPISPSALEEEYSEHIQAEAVFPPDIDDSNVHSSVLRYQSHMNSVIGDLKCVCGCCGVFVSEKESQIYAIDHCLIRDSITLGLLIMSHIDRCAIFDDNIRLCSTCSSLLLLGNRPKFGISNGLLAWIVNPILLRWLISLWLKKPLSLARIRLCLSLN